ncbi:MAG: hypothetical protein KGY38_06300 [Desulfobacterales bacterium]|nr:hypothetical protein [Desulfobacterales bacterium]
MQETFAAAAFAEAGEHDTAMKFAGIQSVAQTVAEKIKQIFDVHMSAACFAEAGCHDTALDMLGTQKPARQRQSLDEFLESVGLQRTQVRYGFANV